MMRRQENNRQNLMLTFLLIAFIILQPFLDYRELFVNEKLQIVGFTIPTLVRFIGIFVMALISLRCITSKKLISSYVAFAIVVILYFLAHHLVVSKEMILPFSYKYSFMSELLYVARMILPFIVLYLTVVVKITYEKFILCIQVVSLTIGIVIIASNLFHVSLTSYYTAGTYNVLNFIEWFTHDLRQYTFEELTSKGWFFMANQIGALMMLLLPINLHDMLKRTNKLSVISSLILTTSMILLGTRVAVYGALGMLLVYVVLFLFFKLTKKEDLKWKSGIVLLVLICVICLLFVYSPIQSRVYSYGEVNTEGIDSVMNDSDYDELDETQVEENVLELYHDFKISDAYILKIYPYNEDLEFWSDFMENYQGEVQNNRNMQNLITQRIAELNNHFLNKLFGYSHTRFTNGGLYLEQDIVVHYYTLGIVGIFVLLGPWFWCLGRLLIRMFIGKNRKISLINCTLAGAIVACIGGSVFSGHVLDELIVTLILGFVVGFATINHENVEAVNEVVP
ncbi:MAG: O-antigen ligase family protein [Tyzzerella sp.]|nr:O-antigen ligase family protein [Tyzzerella sp.]